MAPRLDVPRRGKVAHNRGTPPPGPVESGIWQEFRSKSFISKNLTRKIFRTNDLASPIWRQAIDRADSHISGRHCYWIRTMLTGGCDRFRIKSRAFNHEGHGGPRRKTESARVVEWGAACEKQILHFARNDNSKNMEIRMMAHDARSDGRNGRQTDNS